MSRVFWLALGASLVLVTMVGCGKKPEANMAAPSGTGTTAAPSTSTTTTVPTTSAPTAAPTTTAPATTAPTTVTPGAAPSEEAIRNMAPPPEVNTIPTDNSGWDPSKGGKGPRYKNRGTGE
ncbi:MAG: hypothetical protein ACYDCO_00265 [Armatimonadota bacterium]